MPSRSRSGFLIFTAVILVAAVIAIYGQGRGHDFVNFDDYIYVHQNPNVRSGLTWQGLRAHFTQPYAAYWIPLTWTSLALDVSLWGASAPAMKLTNAALHALGSVLLLLACVRLTGALFPSALVAAVFAVHPLHVESVAWIAQRKDVLSAVFATLTLLAYARYVERPSVGRAIPVAGSYALGLLAKPTLVVLPVALLLLDVWPLGRIRGLTRGARARCAARLVAEKTPLLVLAAGASLIVLYTQRTMGGMEVAGWLRARTQVAMVLESFGWYLGKTLWPAGLGALYPVPTEPPPLWPGLLSALGILLLTAACLLLGRRRPYLAVGWLWFLAMLVPVAGFVHVGVQVRADRWAHLPLIGLSLALAFGLAEVATRVPAARRATVAVSLAALAACAVASWFQVGYWRNTTTVFERAAAVTPGNYYAWDRLAQEHRSAGRFRLAESGYLQALLHAPRWDRPRQHLADLWDEQGDSRAAHALRSVASRPWSEPYGTAALGMALVRGGRFAEARTFVETALAGEPRSPALHTAQAVILARQGDRAGAEHHYTRALDLEPRLYSTAANLAWLQATPADQGRRRPDDAAALAARALAEIRTIEPALLDALAAAHAASGRFPDAIAAGELALAAAERVGEPLVAPIRARLAGYRQGKAPPPGSEQWAQP